MNLSRIKRIITMLLPLMSSSMAIAQDDFQKIFNQFKQANEKEFLDFRKKANMEYVEFLRKSWEDFDGETAMPVPKHDEPVVPPVIASEEDLKKHKEERQIIYEEVIPEVKPVPAPMPIAPIEESLTHTTERLSFSIYNTDCTVRYDESAKPFLIDVNQDAVADYWNELYRSGEVENLLYDCFQLRECLDLCDWAFYKMTESMSKALYPSDRNEATLFHAYVLSQAGFRLRIGYSVEDEHLHFIVAAECDIYEYPYWELDEGRYYLLDGCDLKKMRLVMTDFAGSHPMRLTIGNDNRFAENLSDVRSLASERYDYVKASIRTNLNLLSFYEEYPQALVNNDPRTRWRFYAEAPLGYNVRETLYPQLKQHLSGKSELEAVEILLNFVQTGLEYENDEKIWGMDRAFFADESLYYPFCDCEDRSILFSRLVRDLMGLDVALIYYPGHLAAAVRFNELVEGDYIVVDDIRYTVCDPTYVNAHVGMTIPDMDNSSAFVILLNQRRTP